MALVVAVAAAGPLQHLETTPIPILHSEDSGPNPDGSYAFRYETGNKISMEEASGPLTQSRLAAQPGQEPEQHRSAVGSYSFEIDGVQYKVDYTADENGFQARGAHLPTPPPIPAEIMKALIYNAAHPEEDNL